MIHIARRIVEVMERENVSIQISKHVLILREKRSANSVIMNEGRQWLCLLVVLFPDISRDGEMPAVWAVGYGTKD